MIKETKGCMYFSPIFNTSNSIKIFSRRITSEALQSDDVVSMILECAGPLYQVFESIASPVDGVKAVGSIIYKLFEEYDVIPGKTNP